MGLVHFTFESLHIFVFFLLSKATEGHFFPCDCKMQLHHRQFFLNFFFSIAVFLLDCKLLKPADFGYYMLIIEDGVASQ